VVPVVRQGALDWLTNDEKAVGHAERVAASTAEELSGETVGATAGEADVGLAIRGFTRRANSRYGRVSVRGIRSVR
jgi:hypothetical protein